MLYSMPSTPALNRTLNFDNFFGTIEQSKNKIGTDSKLVSLLLYYQELVVPTIPDIECDFFEFS